MPQRAVVIINPLSGRGRYNSEIQADSNLALATLTRHHFDAQVRPTTKAGDAHAFAKEAASTGCDLVVAWGGDGTINEAASALIESNTTLAIVPAGSGNGLARDLRVPFDIHAALEVAASGRTMKIDAGRIDNCLFFNIAGIGVDAVIAARFAERGMRRRGMFGYLQLSTSELLQYRHQQYQLTIDGQQFAHRAMLIAFANGRQYGNRLLIAPGARLDDGLLEVVVVEPMSLLSVAWRLPSLFQGTLQPGRGVSMRAGKSIRISAEGPIPFHVDGEPRIGSSELAVQTLPGALRVRAPSL